MSPRLFILLPGQTGPSRARHPFLAGLVPAPDPSATPSREVTISGPGGPSRPGLVALLVQKLIGLDLLHAYRNRATIRAADLVWTLTEAEALAAALLMAWGLVKRRPLLAGTGPMMREWPHLPWRKKWLYRRLARRVGGFVAPSSACQAQVAKAFPLAAVHCVPMGGAAPVPPGPAGERTPDPVRIFVQSAEFGGVDWDDFFTAFGNDAAFLITVACPDMTDLRVSVYDNVHLLRGAAALDLEQLYGNADLVVVPGHDEPARAIAAVLEGVARSRPVLTVTAPWIASYFADDQLLLCPRGDPDAMRAVAIATDRSQRAAIAVAGWQRYARSDYTLAARTQQLRRLERAALPAER